MSCSSNNGPTSIRRKLPFVFNEYNIFEEDNHFSLVHNKLFLNNKSFHSIKLKKKVEQNMSKTSVTMLGVGSSKNEKKKKTKKAKTK